MTRMNRQQAKNLIVTNKHIYEHYNLKGQRKATT